MASKVRRKLSHDHEDDALLAKGEEAVYDYLDGDGKDEVLTQKAAMGIKVMNARVTRDGTRVHAESLRFKMLQAIVASPEELAKVVRSLRPDLQKLLQA